MRSKAVAHAGSARHARTRATGAEQPDRRAVDTARFGVHIVETAGGISARIALQFVEQLRDQIATHSTQRATSAAHPTRRATKARTAQARTQRSARVAHIPP